MKISTDGTSTSLLCLIFGEQPQSPHPPTRKTRIAMTNREIIHRLYNEAIKDHQGRLFVAMICMVVVSGFTGIQVWLVKDLLDKIFLEKNTFYLKLLPLVVIAVFFTKGIFYYTYTILLERVGQSVIRDFRSRLFNHIHQLSLSFFNETPTGTLISRIISDVSLLQQAVSKALVGAVRDLFQIVILLGFVFVMDWKLAMVTFIVLPAAILPIIHFGRLFRRLSTRTQEETALVSNILHETITGNRIVKAFGREDYEGERFSRQVESLFQLTIKEARYRCIQHPLMEFIGGLAIAAIIWFGGIQVIHGGSTPGTFFAFLTALIAAYEPVKAVSKINATIQQGLAAAVRIYTLLDTEPEIKDSADAIPLPPFRREINFTGITFRYDNNTSGNGDDRVLKDLNLCVTAGEVIAIVGPSGGGKTTLTNLIPRFIDLQEGAITIDGRDIRDVTIRSLRNQISMVTQQTILFNDTVKNNISYSRSDASAAEIEEVARAAHASDFIGRLPAGFETVIGEGGARLSGGEKQRISIARALLKNAPILILDEATSALDTESEQEVQKALENLMKNRTTFVIAHRLSTIRNADRIIVVQDGRIIEEGDHQSLLALGGVYHQLHNIEHR